MNGKESSIVCEPVRPTDAKLLCLEASIDNDQTGGNRAKGDKTLKTQNMRTQTRMMRM